MPVTDTHETEVRLVTLHETIRPLVATALDGVVVRIDDLEVHVVIHANGDAEAKYRLEGGAWTPALPHFNSAAELGQAHEPDLEFHSRAANR